MINLSQIYESTSSDLMEHLQQVTHNIDLFEVYNYALAPSGKLFRPIIFKLFYFDLTQQMANPNICYISSALEFHHVYTLIHDDLPAMDDDDQRRGRESTHIRFNEWKAILAGDGLLNASYNLISKCQPNYSPRLLTIFSKLLGPKGLIRGQYLDLSGEINNNIEHLVETHFLKTSRLIQTSLLSALVISDKFEYEYIKSTLRLGRSLGLVFQLLDDLLELTEKLNQHEKEINPWIQSPELTIKILLLEMKTFNQVITKLQLTILHHYITTVFFSKTRKKIINSKEEIQIYVKELMPIILALNVIKS